MKIRGRRYGDDLARLDLLVSSLVDYAPRLLDDPLIWDPSR
jgi:hypothetical protein